MFLFYRRKADAQMCFENVSVTLYCKFVAGDFGASALRSPAQFCLSPILEGWNRNSPIPESQLLSSSPSLTPSLSHSSSQWTGETWPAGQPCLSLLYLPWRSPGISAWRRNLQVRWRLADLVLWVRRRARGGYGCASQPPP